jgi:predicted RNA-binding Zn ribbon-like protein
MLLKVPKATIGFQPAGRAPAPPPLDLVQDFVNTEIPEWAQDDIATPDLLARWLHVRGLLAYGDGVESEAFVAARALRGLLRRLALQNTLGEAPRENAHAEFAGALSGIRLRVELGPRGELQPVADGSPAMRALAAIVVRVLDAQASGAWGRLKACRKASCGWLFYDGSRNASSTWCSMSICGNRTKTAAYRRRRRSAE